MSNVAKVRRAPVQIDIGDGKQRTLKYTLNAFALLEEKYGTIDSAMEAMEKGSISTVRYCLWAGLVHEDEELTEKYVGGCIEIPDLEFLAEKLNKAMVGDLPEKVDSIPNA